jgi:hypothetical protein
MKRRDDAFSVLDELFSQVEDMQERVRTTLEEPPAPPPPEPVVRVEAAAPGWTVDAVLAEAADAASEVRDADAVLVRLFDGGRAAVGMSEAEAERYSVGPPPVGPRVWALAIAYEPDPAAAGSREPIGTALAVPILRRDRTIGFLAVYSRSPDVVFDEQQGRDLQAIASWVPRALAAVDQPEPEPVEALAPVPVVAEPAPAAEPSTPRPWLRTVLLVVAGLSCVAAPAFAAAGIHSGLRVAAALALLTLAPGVAALPLFGSRSAPVELGLVAGTSLGVSALVAEVTLWLGVWSPRAATAGVAVVSLISIVVQLTRRTAARAPRLGAA